MNDKKTIKVAKWGNAAGIRLPKKVMETLSLQESDELYIAVKGKTIILERKEKQAESIHDLFAHFDEQYPTKELQWGDAQGEELPW